MRRNCFLSKNCFVVCQKICIFAHTYTKTTMKRNLLTILLIVLAFHVSAETDTEHVRLTNLPHVYINTFSGNSISSKNVMVDARMWYVDENDSVTFYDSLKIRVRGNSTASLAKKPYKLKFNEKVKLLGKGYAKTKKWTMLANHGDKTLLRNALTSLMGERAGLKFNPAAKFVDLTVNKRYVGNYQISDQVDVRPHRVNIVEQDYPLTEKSNITGGYLLEADGFKDFENWKTGFYSDFWYVPLRIHYPDEDEIDSRQLIYIREFVNDFEQRLFSSNFTDPLTGYRPLVDSISLANWYICTEICANPDGFFSTYFYKEQDDNKLYWGPLWDYDIAYNNDNRSRGGTSNTERQLMKDYGYGDYGSGCRAWVEEMWRDPWFARLINRRFNQLIDDGMETYLNQKLDSLCRLIDASQKLNFDRWGIRTRALRERILYNTYSEYVDYVRTFLKNHIPYLKRAFAEMLPDAPPIEPEERISDFQADGKSYYAIVNNGSGTCFDVDMQTDEVCGWTPDKSRESQQWIIKTLSNGYLFIVNRATGKALADPSPVGATAQTETGGTLYTATPDSADTRQLWDFVLQADGVYNIVSRWSEHAANLSQGSSNDGTPVLSYNSDERNSVSSNRLWSVMKTGDVIDTEVNTLTQDYALAYDPYSGLLHFGADNPQDLTFTVRIYNQAGRQIAAFKACDGFNLLSYPTGLYIISWKYGDRQQSVKLMKD